MYNILCAYLGVSPTVAQVYSPAYSQYSSDRSPASSPSILRPSPSISSPASCPPSTPLQSPAPSPAYSLMSPPSNRRSISSVLSCSAPQTPSLYPPATPGMEKAVVIIFDDRRVDLCIQLKGIYTGDEYCI